jgi:hypothetical protein
MASGCLVLVDGWNHFLRTRDCFGNEVAVRFPVDRLAARVAAVIGEDTVTDVAVVMALPDRNRPEEESDFWAWRRKLNKLANYGVRHEKAKFSYNDLACANCGSSLKRTVTCPNCQKENPLPGRRKEKGADVMLATLALNGAWRQDHSSLVVFAQDADYGPMARQITAIYQEQGRLKCQVYSAFPKCSNAAHDHRGVPNTRWMPIDAETYSELGALPFADPRS